MQNGSDDRSRFAVNLGRLRREKGLSQRQAARELGVSQALLSHYETDAREPKLDFVLKVCDYYDVSADYILGRTHEREDGASRLAEKVGIIVDSLEDLKLTEASLMSKLKTLTVKNGLNNGFSNGYHNGSGNGSSTGPDTKQNNKS